MSRPDTSVEAIATVILTNADGGDEFIRGGSSSSVSVGVDNSGGSVTAGVVGVGGTGTAPGTTTVIIRPSSHIPPTTSAYPHCYTAFPAPPLSSQTSPNDPCLPHSITSSWALQASEDAVLERCQLQSMAAAAASKIRRLRMSNDDWARQAQDTLLPQSLKPTNKLTLSYTFGHPLTL